MRSNAAVKVDRRFHVREFKWYALRYGQTVSLSRAIPMGDETSRSKLEMDDTDIGRKKITLSTGSRSQSDGNEMSTLRTLFATKKKELFPGSLC